jgi:type I restriction enzyme S subunit
MVTMKQTEIGLLPEHWEVKNLNQIGNFSKGKGISKTEANSGEIPAIRYGELYTKHHNVIRKFYSFINPKVADNSIRLKKGDILFAGSGETKEEIGKSVAFVNDEQAFVGGDIVILSPNKFCDPTFLGYLLNSKEVQQQKSANGQGDAVVHIYASSLKNIQIPLPPLPEQEAIAEALSDADAWIESLEQLIAKKRLIKQGAMQELLTPKADWEVKKLGEVIDVYRGGSPRPIQNYITDKLDGINWIKIGDTSSTGKYIVSTSEKIIPDGEKNSRRVYPGDFLLSNSMSFGRPYILKIDGCIHDGWLVLQNYNASFDTEFLYYLLTSKYIIDQYKSKAAGSGVLNLNKEVVSTVELIIPSLTEQTRIATILSDMDTELEALETQLSKAKQIKQGMMQELLTGRIRLV